MVPARFLLARDGKALAEGCLFCDGSAFWVCWDHARSVCNSLAVFERQVAAHDFEVFWVDLPSVQPWFGRLGEHAPIAPCSKCRWAANACTCRTSIRRPTPVPIRWLVAACPDSHENAQTRLPFDREALAEAAGMSEPEDL
jgi:hypothetical protein